MNNYTIKKPVMRLFKPAGTYYFDNLQRKLFLTETSRCISVFLFIPRSEMYTACYKKQHKKAKAQTCSEERADVM